MNNHTPRRSLHLLVGLVAVMLLSQIAGKALGDGKVLVVIPDRNTSPALCTHVIGLSVLTDLVGAGIPFDVLPYSKFINRPLDIYDVIIVNGQTSPTPVSTVRDKLVAASNAGKKILISGRYPYFRFDDVTGKIVEEIHYSQDLFGAKWGWANVSAGSPTVPPDLEKDPVYTAYGSVAMAVPGYTPTATQPRVFTRDGVILGFLGPKGGAMNADYCYNALMDFGKAVNYLRHGDSRVVGFANDREGGVPLVSLMVDCDSTKDTIAINNLIALKRSYNMIFDCLLVYTKLDAPSTALWKQYAATEPGIYIGSHTWDHPFTWATVTNVPHETVDAIAATRALIPQTLSFMNLSGDMAVNSAQADQIYSAGILLQNGNSDDHNFFKPDGTKILMQTMPYDYTRLLPLSSSQSEPPDVGLTLPVDYGAWKDGRNYLDIMRQAFLQNRAYGLPSFGYIHDYMQNPATPYFYQGKHMSYYEDQVFQFLVSQGVRFYPAHLMEQRLQDSRRGNISCQSVANGLDVTATRPAGSPLNEIKIQLADGEIPWISGSSVTGIVRDNGFAYISLAHEPVSQVSLRWTGPAPVVHGSGNYATPMARFSATWTVVEGDQAVDNYRYAIGTTPGGTEVVEWTDLAPRAPLSRNVFGCSIAATYYISLKAHCSTGAWTSVGTSAGFTLQVSPSRLYTSPPLSDSWNFFSIPAVPESPDPLVVLAGEDAPNSSLLKWNNSAAGGGYQIFGLDWPGPMECGSSYWMICGKANPPISFFGTPSMNPAQITFPAGNSPRWVTFGHPFDVPVSADAVKFSNAEHPTPLGWADAYDAGMVEGNAMGFDSGRIFTVGPSRYMMERQQLEPWHGYWLLLYSPDPVTLTIALPSQ